MKALVIGGARSGLAAAKLLRQRQYTVTVSDVSALSASTKAELTAINVSCHEGFQDDTLLHDVTLVVASPGVNPEIDLLRQARAQHIDVTTEVCLALRYFSAPWIGITGTNGKSTTTVMIAHLLQKLGYSSLAGGNLGLPACEIVMEHHSIDPLLLELSSYQLQYELPHLPTVAIFTSFSPDHLARHGTIEAYFAAKWRLFSNQQSLRILDPSSHLFAKKFGYDTTSCTVIDHVLFHDELASLSFAKHDFTNASAALVAAAYISGKSPGALLPLLADFQGLPYRFQEIAKNGLMPVINDSKATNVASTLTALESLATCPAILLCGGEGKGESFAPIAEKSSKIKALVTFGQSSEQIASELSMMKQPILRFKTLAQAMKEYRSWWQPDTTILFSPACASFDEFNNFEHRGEFFTSEVLRITTESQAK